MRTGEQPQQRPNPADTRTPPQNGQADFDTERWQKVLDYGVHYFVDRIREKRLDQVISEREATDRISMTADNVHCCLFVLSRSSSSPQEDRWCVRMDAVRCDSDLVASHYLFLGPYEEAVAYMLDPSHMPEWLDGFKTLCERVDDE